jgi:hypothetical protein
MKNINLAKSGTFALAAMTLGFSVQAANFTDIAASAGLDVNSRTAGWADYDGDGCLDVMLATDSAPVLMKNNCDSTFTDVTAAAGITGPIAPWAIAWADYDADGDLDVYVPTGSADSGMSSLWQNNGDGTFTDVAAAVGVPMAAGVVGASWSDYDNDGDLDLFGAARFAGVDNNFDFLYRNDDGIFTDVSVSSGVQGPGERQTFMGIWFDYDMDGDQDLYLSVDFGTDVLYQNNDAVFTDVSAIAGVGAPGHGMGVYVGDLNNDGWFDIVSSNNNRSNVDDDELDDHGPSIIYLNNADGTFTVASYASGIKDTGAVKWGVNFIDYDLDGDLDFAEAAGGMLSAGEANLFYENDGSGQLVDITDAAGLTDLGAALGSSWADIDADGDLDWLVNNTQADIVNTLFENNSATGNFLRVKLNGADKNLDAVGATIKITSGSRTQMRTIQAGLSYGNSEELVALFGLGVKEVVDTVTVMWPTGGTTEMTGVAAGQTLVISEDGAEPPMFASISGTVVSSTGGVVTDAVVDFRDPDTGEVFFVIRADAAGNYSGEIPAGLYQMAALSRISGLSRPFVRAIAAGEVIELDFVLRPPRN